ALPPPRRTRVPRGDGDGRRQARPAARRRARPHRPRRNDGGDGVGARAVGRPVRPPRERRPQDEDPARAVPRLRRRRGPVRRAAGESFSQALIDEGLAGALGVARTLAEKYHLPLVDLAVAGVDAEAVKLIALPVLSRVVAIPFASDGSRLKVAITDPHDVRGL